MENYKESILLLTYFQERNIFNGHFISYTIFFSFFAGHV